MMQNEEDNKEMQHRAYDDTGVGDINTYFRHYPTSAPIVTENDKYVVIHETMDENYKNLCLNNVLFRPDNGTFMFVDTGNDIYLEYGSFQLVKKFMSSEEIGKFERVKEEAVHSVSFQPALPQTYDEMDMER